MNNRNFVRGLVLCAIALAFGIPACGYRFGTLSNAGPGLFPLMVSGLLLVIGLGMLVRARLVAAEPLGFQFGNIAIILVSLCGFAWVSRLVDMTAGIVFMVFVAAFAGRSPYSVPRNLKIALGLVAVAFAFQKLLKFNLPLL